VYTDSVPIDTECIPDIPDVLQSIENALPLCDMPPSPVFTKSTIDATAIRESITQAPVAVPEKPVDEVVASVVVFNELGRPVKMGRRVLSRNQKNQKEQLDPEKLRGPRCQHYQEDSTKRSKSRANIVDGLLKKMKDLKTTTNDDSLLVVYKDYNTDIATARKFATNLELVSNTAASSSLDAPLPPPAAVLASLSPSKPNTTVGSEARCPVCGITYGEERDDEFDSLWIGCSSKSCDIWQHVKCVGLQGITKTKLRTLHWLCPVHRDKPCSSRPQTKKNKTSTKKR